MARASKGTQPRRTAGKEDKGSPPEPCASSRAPQWAACPRPGAVALGVWEPGSPAGRVARAGGRVGSSHAARSPQPTGERAGGSGWRFRRGRCQRRWPRGPQPGARWHIGEGGGQRGPDICLGSTPALASASSAELLPAACGPVRPPGQHRQGLRCPESRTHPRRPPASHRPCPPLALPPTGTWAPSASSAGLWGTGCYPHREGQPPWCPGLGGVSSHPGGGSARWPESTLWRVP